MRLFKILGVAIMAVLALGAFASATASAAVTILPEKEEVKWTGESGKATLEVLEVIVSVVLCAKAKWEGIVEANKPLGVFHIDLEGCKVLGPCNSLGEAKEVFLALGTYHLVFDTLEVKLS